MSRSRLALAAACAATLTFAPTAFADGGGGNVTPRDPGARRFVENVSVPEIVKHQVALQQIATLNDDTREVFSPGYNESLDYVVQTLRDAGYNPKVTPFNYPVWKETQAPVLNMVSPAPGKTYRPGTAADDGSPNVDFITMGNSAKIELSKAPVFPVGEIDDPPVGGGDSGCTAADYAGVAGKVALIQRGTCSFVAKWGLAEAAGAVGVIIYNEGNTPERQNPIFVEDGIDSKIAAVIASYTLGNDLLQAYKAGKNPTVDFKVYGFFEPRFLNQVIAETRGGDPNNVVVVGAHLDSVPEGPGINDDGSGTAAQLAMAEELAHGHYNLRQKVRFAWWGAEENGLVGSRYYAKNLSDAEVKKIDVMLDYDMLASPNYIRGIYDGDGDDPPEDPNVPNPPGPTGSGRVEDVFDEWFKAQGMKSERGAFDGRSDYVGFTLRGIPSGGVFAGAEGEKTAAQEAIYGGAAGSYYDPCYHQICDNLQTVLTGVPPLSAEGLAFYVPNATEADKRAAQRKMKGGALRSLKELSGAAAYGVYYWAMSKDGFNSKPHGGNPPKWPPHRRWNGHGHRNDG